MTRRLQHRLLFSSAVLSLLCITSLTASAQSLGGLARQERERKNNQPPRATRVYTDADLKKPQILDPEDRARIAAARDAVPMPAAQAVQTAASSTAPPAQQALSEAKFGLASPPRSDAPLGDVARYYRRQKELREQPPATKQNSVFASFESARPPDPPATVPALVSTAPVAADIGAPNPPPANAPLGDVARYHWKLKRSRERALAASLPPQPSAAVISTSRIRPPNPASPPAPSHLAGVRVERGDSLWRIAEKHLGNGAQWRELARINPELRDPNLLRIGAWIRLPRGVSEVAKVVRAAQGDTLWQIARAEYGNTQAWTCVARANPQLRDPNRILPGQILSLPLACSTLP